VDNDHRDKLYEYNEYRTDELPIGEAESLLQDYEISMDINKLSNEIYRYEVSE
jgi:hypothetical protein